MDFHTRWLKILKDIWGNRRRSILVILSIAVGIASVGMINNGARMINRDLFGTFSKGNPASLNIYVSPFDDNLVNAVEAMREIKLADARRVENALVVAGEEPYTSISLHGMDDFSEMSLGKLRLEAGSLNPNVREVVLERQSAVALGVAVGDQVTVDVNDLQYVLTVSGLVHDMYIPPYSVTGDYSGYLSLETLGWMGFPATFNRLDILVAENEFDREHVLNTGAEVRDRIIEPAGYFVGSIQVPGFDADPGEYWAQNQMNGFMLILQVMSVLAIFLSGGLVINTISAMLTQQIRQIGIMRSVGAVRGQLVQMYLVNVLVFSTIAFLIALPPALFGSWALANLASDFMNFDITVVDLSPGIVALMAGVGFVMPIAVALYPILAGTRISVYDAIYQHGLTTEGKQGPVDRLLVKVKALSPPVLLSLRNTFRKKTRLAFTLITLTLAGAMFISVFSTRLSLSRAVDEIERYFSFDAALSIPGGATYASVEREAMRIPGVTVAEGWATATGLLAGEGQKEEEFSIYATPETEIRTIEPLLLEGRWLRPEDASAVVINEDLVTTSGNTLALGDELVFEVNEHERSFEIVGIVSRHLVGPRAYMNYGDFNKVTGRQNQVNIVHVRSSADNLGSPAVQDGLAALLEERFDNAGISDRNSSTQHTYFASFTDAFNIILIILIVMAAILATVGGLSLTGTMGMNVIERTREIGVLRAVGASNGAVRKVVLIEGVVVGLISWVLASILSGPAGYLLAGAVVKAVMDSDLVYVYSYEALGAWLGIVALIGVFSTLGPARRAERLTVREVLDYE